MRLLLCAMGLLLIAGCANNSSGEIPLRSQVGKNCIVYLRKDILGMAADVPSSVMTGNLNGAEVTQMGKLMSVGDNWIVIGYQGRILHIPNSSIQMVEFGGSVATRPDLSEPPPRNATEGHGQHSS